MIVLQENVGIVLQAKPAIEFQHTFRTDIISVETFVADLINAVVTIISATDVESRMVRTTTDRDVVPGSEVVVTVDSSQPIGIAVVFVVTVIVGALFLKQRIGVASLQL